jgi:hypothetical protein
LGSDQAHRHQSEPCPPTRRQYLRLHGHWRGLASGTGVPQAACLQTTSTSMWVRQAARLLLTCRRVFCQCQACHQNPRASSAQLVRASLLTSRSGVRASRGTFCLLGLSFGMLCATTQVASMSSMDLHSFWKVYVRTPLGFRLISISSGPSCKGCPEKFHWISVDLCPL